MLFSSTVNLTLIACNTSYIFYLADIHLGNSGVKLKLKGLHAYMMWWTSAQELCPFPTGFSHSYLPLLGKININAFVHFSEVWGQLS